MSDAKMCLHFTKQILLRKIHEILRGKQGFPFLLRFMMILRQVYSRHDMTLAFTNYNFN